MSHNFGRLALVATLLVPVTATAVVRAETLEIVVAQNDQHPSEAALLKIISDLQRGQPDYTSMSTALRDAMRQQGSAVASALAQLGPLQRTEFVATQAGVDVYRVTFARGVTQWVIRLSADGTIEALSFRPDTTAAAAPEASGEDVATAGMSGTLLKPAGAVVRPPTVLLIAGSGPTDRNGNQFGAGPGYLRELANQLAQRNVASLRYDKRGVGRSSAGTLREEQITLQSSVDDAAAWATWLARRSDLGPLIVAGHSEGGIIAILLSERRPVSGLVLLATPGRRLGDVLRDQFAATGMPQPLLDEALATLAALERGESVTKVDPALLSLFRPSVQPFLRSVLAVDPAQEFKTLALPALIVSGGRDVQVLAADANALANARPDAAQLHIPEMNHALQGAQDRQVPERKDGELAPSLIDAVASFIGKLPGSAAPQP